MGDPGRASGGALLGIDEPQLSGGGPLRPYDCYLPAPVLEWLDQSPGALVKSIEGTMVFADVSGFTRLSERLQRTGREGAERLVDAISSCWRALLLDAYALGASLLKFGGDALLLWFEGPDHALRASASAFAMRRKLGQVGRVQVGSSQVILRMSVGIHSGVFNMFLVGDSHREHLIAGEAMTVTAMMEKAASAGQILISADTAAALPRTWLGASCGPGRLIAKPSMPEGTPRELARPAEDAVLGCLSTEVRTLVTSTGIRPEHRTASIAFIELGELDRFIAERGPEAAARELDGVVRTAQEAADRYRVCFQASDVAPDGARILFSAGAPRVLGDDEERMLLALRHVIESEHELPIRIGVNRGHVFSAEVGPPFRRTYVAMGDTTNLAARLMAKAPWGSIYATRGLLERADWRFDTTPVAPFLVKGKTKPIEAWELGPARRTLIAEKRGRLPLIGRDRELESIRSATDRARKGLGSVIELVGETGSGKSRLLAEARDAAAGMRQLHATCEAYTQQTPYSTWREPLRELLGMRFEDDSDHVVAKLRAALRKSHPELLQWLPLLAIAVGADAATTPEVEQLAPEARVATLHRAVLDLLREALVVPTLIQIEHAHLMDAASAALLEALSAELGSSAWLVLITRRDVAGNFSATPLPGATLELGPLSPEDLRLVAEASPEASSLPPHVVELAVDRAGGSPEFLLDLLASAAAGAEELPENVETAAMARIDALEPGDRELVRRASVLGLSFNPSQLAHVLADEAAHPGQQDWSRLSQVFARDPDGHVRFKRPALQEAAHASLPFKLRRELHAAVAASMAEAEADPAVLSLHLLLADDHARAHRYAMLGAARATSRFSHADAARLYRRAIDTGRAAGMLNDPGGTAALAHAWEQLGDALRCTGEPAAAAHALTSARRLVGEDPVGQARLSHRHAEVAQRSESLTAAVRWLKRGLRCLDGLGDDEEANRWRARLRSYLGGVRVRQGRWVEATQLCGRAIEEAESVGELYALARACYMLDWALFEQGRTDEATHSERALEIYIQAGDPEHEATVLNNLGMFAYYEGRWDDAIELYERSGACSKRAGRPSDAAFTDCNVGEILSDQGHLDQARVHLERARRVWSSTGDRQSVAFVDVLLARLAVRDGRYGEGVPMLERAAAELRRFGIEFYADFARALLAEAEAFAGDAARAIELVESELRSGDRNLPLLRRAAGIAHARLGALDEARRALEDALAIARERDADHDVAVTIQALADLGAAAQDLQEEQRAIIDKLKIARMLSPQLG